MTLQTVLGGLCLCFLGFETKSRALDAVGVESDRADHLGKWVVLLALVGWVLLVEDRALASIGWRLAGTPLETVWWTLGTTVALLAANVVFAPLWARLPGDDAIREGMGAFAGLSVGEKVAISITAGATEEPLFRGYPIERIGEVTGFPILGALVGGLAFLAGHVGDVWSPAAAARMAQPTVVLTGVYLLTGSLPVVVAAHALNDVVGLLLAERYVDSA